MDSFLNFEYPLRILSSFRFCHCHPPPPPSSKECMQRRMKPDPFTNKLCVAKLPFEQNQFSLLTALRKYLTSNYINLFVYHFKAEQLKLNLESKTCFQAIILILFPFPLLLCCFSFPNSIRAHDWLLPITAMWIVLRLAMNGHFVWWYWIYQNTWMMFCTSRSKIMGFIRPYRKQ